MSYQEQSDLYRHTAGRGRYEMCIREQAHLTFADDADPADRALANDVISGDGAAIDALIAAICVGPNSATLGDDEALLSAVQTAWPTTAGALYTEGV